MEVPPDYGEKKGIPAGRPRRDEDMAQTALYIASNEHLYGQVRFTTVRRGCEHNANIYSVPDYRC